MIGVLKMDGPSTAGRDLRDRVPAVPTNLCPTLKTALPNALPSALPNSLRSASPKAADLRFWSIEGRLHTAI